MNLTQISELLNDRTRDYLTMLYRQSKITHSVQINFLAARLDLPYPEAVQTARLLQQSGMICYEKYGRITLTDAGKSYAKQLTAQEKKTIF